MSVSPLFGTPDRPILIVGASGMLARAWMELLDARSLAYESVDFDRLDLTRPETIPAEVCERHGLVVNCAAYTDVDGAETNEDLARKINGDGVGDLATRCAQIGATLIHYSTDYVFSGDAEAPYPTDAPRQPLGAYGHTKAVAEELIERSGADYLIARTSWLYAPWGKNFVNTIASLVTERDTIKVVDDQRGRPTSCQHLAATSLALLQNGERGIFHVTDGGECTWHEFAREIARLTGATCDVQPCTTDEFPRPAPRPTYSVLDLSKTEASVGAMPDWRENLAAVLDAQPV
ncbi:MAG: dTDP-4-dehydrorhamnose reductase [Planctomycetota bacterium]|jgi:dTDP-4-dehydrorhamnose reductase